ncbi:hypothetical protein DPMN_046873 [Dreissena polymorpha]|uniref:Uncharacterized protein n=1 Tax=Dreissena polymorpha TaxID=45954 RepID=A0A9D4D6S4_DREPO|nr:hypothetical protein DPMN_046873 [Dreissena polymorpha]
MSFPLLQVWMYAKLYNEEEKFTTQAVLQAAEKGSNTRLTLSKESTSQFPSTSQLNYE